MKILIVRLDHLGDLLLMTPLIRALSQAGHQVDLVVPRVFCPIFDHNPHCQNVFTIEEIAPDFPREWFRFGRWMRTKTYDGILLPEAIPRQLLLSSFLSGAGVRIAMRAGLLGRLTLHRCIAAGPGFTDGRHYSDLQ